MEKTPHSSDIEATNNTFHDFIKFFRDIVIILLIVFCIRSFIVTPFRINGTSMEESYYDKEYILVNIFSYLNFGTHFEDAAEKAQDPVSKTFYSALKSLPIHLGDPNRGDVVVVKPHVDESREFYIKRIIGMPHETIKFSSGQVFIKKENAPDFIQISEPYLSFTNSGHTYLPTNVKETEFTIPEGMYWVMGDNRLNSADSRSCFIENCLYKNSTHFLKRSQIVGKVFIDFGHFDLFKDNEFPKLGTLSWMHKPRFFDTPSTASYPELDS